LKLALQRRAALHGQPGTNAYRLVHRAADGFPDLAVDRYADVLIAHVYSTGAKVQPPLKVLHALADTTGAQTVYVKYRPTQASVLDERDRATLAPAQPLWGPAITERVVQENGLNYLIRPGAGLSVGLFLDMREMRAWVREQAAGRTVLNCFAYTCGFGVAALAGGAARAVNIDASRRYLEWGKENTALNGFKPDLKDFISGDVFDWLKRFGKRGQQFEIVILDPPSYSTTRYTRFSVLKDYAELVASAARVVAPGGWLIACANSAELPLSTFKTNLRAGLAGYPARIVRLAHEPAIDFPVPPGGEPYLKIGLASFSSPVTA
jgi:23S rRNA (cytosine1962-C5)-methyltransferase